MITHKLIATNNEYSRWKKISCGISLLLRVWPTIPFQSYRIENWKKIKSIWPHNWAMDLLVSCFKSISSVRAPCISKIEGAFYFANRDGLSQFFVVRQMSLVTSSMITCKMHSPEFPPWRISRTPFETLEFCNHDTKNRKYPLTCFMMSSRIASASTLCLQTMHVAVANDPANEYDNSSWEPIESDINQIRLLVRKWGRLSSKYCIYGI